MVRRGLTSMHKRLFLVLVLCYGIGFLWYLGVSLFTFPGKLFLLSFRQTWTIDNALIGLLNAMIPLQCTAILLAYSFTPSAASISSSRRAEMGSDALVRMVSSSLAIFLAFTLVYTIVTEGLRPALYRKLDELQYTTAIARNFLKEADEARRAGNLKDAASEISSYLAIDPSYEPALELRETIRQSQRQAVQASAHQAVQQVSAPQLTDRTPAQLIQLARDYYDKHDYFSAYYYATLADTTARQDGSARPDATRLAAQAWEMLSTVQPSASEKDAAQLFNMKKRGLAELTSNDPAQMIEAYYLFKSIVAGHPNDAEAARYYSAAVKAIQGVSFFLSNAEGMAAMPGIHDVLFVNSWSDTSREIVYFGKVVVSNVGVFVEHVEVMSFAPDGKEQYDLRAPYARLLNGNLVMHGIDQDDPNRSTHAVYLYGSRPSPVQDILPISATTDELRNLSVDQVSVDQLGFLDLWSSLSILPRFGYSNRPALVEGMLHIAGPFTFLIFSIMAMAFGWRLRSRRTIPPLFTLIFVPGLPFLVFWILGAYLFLHRLVFSGLAFIAGNRLAVGLTIAEQSVLLIAAVFVLAGQSSLRQSV